MVLVTVISTGEHEGDIRALGRIIRGIEGMESKGYIVEQYERWISGENPLHGKAKYKRILAVMRTDEADDAEYEEWLRSLWDKHAPPAEPPPDTDTNPAAEGVSNTLIYADDGAAQSFLCLRGQNKAPAIGE